MLWLDYALEEEALQTVEELNMKFYDVGGPEDMIPFTFTSTGYAFGILFMDQMVWSTEDDDRVEVIPDGTKLESLKDYILRKTRELVRFMSAAYATS